MEYDKRIKEILEQKIQDLQIESNNLTKKYLKEKEETNTKLHLINSLLDNPSLLKDLSLEKLQEIEPNILEDQLKNLKFYQIILKQKRNLAPSYLEKLKNILTSIKAKFEEDIEKITEMFEHHHLKEQIIKLKDLLKKVQIYDLKPDDIDLLSNILIEKQSIKEVIQIIKYLSLKTLQKLDQPPININNDEILKTNLNINDLINLLQKYKIDYNLLSDNAKQELQEYGNLENINDILTTFNKYLEIDKYIKNYPLQIARILIYSNKDKVKSILDTYIKYGINISDKTDQIFKSPSKFIERKRKFLPRTGSNSSSNFKEEEFGTNEDFIQNIELFANLGLDIKKAYDKSYCYFERPHQHILICLKNFELYGIDKEVYLKTLSCFRTHKQLDTLDMFIELDAFDYVKNNMSMSCIPVNSPTFYKLTHLKNQGIQPNDLYIRGIKFPYTITSDAKVFQGINRTNGKEVTKAYTPINPIFEEYDKVINKSLNNTINIILSDNDSCVKKLDQQYISIDQNNMPDYRLYLINGIRISRMKVLRYMNTLVYNGFSENIDMLMYAITKNSILTEEEYNLLNTEIKKIFNELRR